MWTPQKNGSRKTTQRAWRSSTRFWSDCIGSHGLRQARRRCAAGLAERSNTEMTKPTLPGLEPNQCFRVDFFAPGKNRPQYYPSRETPPKEGGRPRRPNPDPGPSLRRPFRKCHLWIPRISPALRGIQLARAEPDKAKAAILREIADEAERDVLWTVDKMKSGFRRAPPTQERKLA